MILIAQGNSRSGESIRYFLQQANFHVCLVTGARLVGAKIEKQHPAAMFVEMGAVVEDHRSLYAVVRSMPIFSDVPVILYSTVKGKGQDDENRIAALEMGADDYVGQPLNKRELVAHVQAVLRRFRHSENAGASQFQCERLPSRSEGLPPEFVTIGEIQIDSSSMKIAVKGREVRTTTLEFRLLYYLSKNPQRVFTRDQLLDAVWGGDIVSLRSVDACIRRIRHNIEPDPSRPTYIKTLRGGGYLMNVQNQVAKHPRTQQPFYDNSNAAVSSKLYPTEVSFSD